jgi:MarR family transcriptional regulator, organic hydroperoxide resistance regulator
LVKRLEQAGFLSRRRNPQDEREVKVHLTSKGKGLRSEADCLNDRLLERSGMTVDEMITLNRKVQALVQALTRSVPDESA